MVSFHDGRSHVEWLRSWLPAVDRREVISFPKEDVARLREIADFLERLDESETGLRMALSSCQAELSKYQELKTIEF